MDCGQHNVQELLLAHCLVSTFTRSSDRSRAFRSTTDSTKRRCFIVVKLASASSRVNQSPLSCCTSMEAQSGVLGQQPPTGGVGRLFSTVLIALLTWTVVHRLRAWYRLRQFKGPLLASLSRIWLVRVIIGGTMHLDFQKINDKYGKILCGRQLSTFVTLICTVLC